MSPPYSTPRPISGTLGHALSVIGDAVQGHIEDHGVRAVGQSIGQAKSNIHAWGADLNAWDAAPLLILARKVPEIGAAVVALINGADLPSANPTDAVPAAYQTARRANELMRTILDAVEDGKFDQDEKDAIVESIDLLSTLLPKLRRDVLAAVR